MTVGLKRTAQFVALLLTGCFSPVETSTGAQDSGVAAVGGAGGAIGVGGSPGAAGAGGAMAGSGGFSAAGGMGGQVNDGPCSSSGVCWVPGFEPTLRAVHGSGVSHVVAVGDVGTVLEFDGTRWMRRSVATRKTLRGVWVASPTQGFAVGDDGVLVELSGGSWRLAPSLGTKRLNAISGVDAAHIWAVGESGAVYFYDGTRWAPIDIGAGMTHLRTVTAISEDEVFVAGDKFLRRLSGISSIDAGSYNQPPDRTDYASSTSCGGDFYVSGVYSDEILTVMMRPPAGVWGALNYNSASKGAPLWCSPSRQVWFIDERQLHLNAGATTRAQTLPRTSYALWGATSDDFWVVGSGGMRVRVIQGLVPTTMMSAGLEVTGFTANSSTNVWVAMADRNIHRFDGQTWSMQPK